MVGRDTALFSYSIYIIGRKNLLLVVRLTTRFYLVKSD